VQSIAERMIARREAARLNTFVRRWRWRVLGLSLRELRALAGAAEPVGAPPQPEKPRRARRDSQPQSQPRH
jgi:hypothetical protein